MRVLIPGRLSGTVIGTGDRPDDRQEADVGRDDGDDYESDQLEPEDTLDGQGGDVLDEGYSPPERPWVGGAFGVTAQEEAARETLGGRLAREVPEPVQADDDGLGDTTDTDGELLDDEVGWRRSGRLVAADRGGPDGDADLWATDVGIDGAGASAEEAAMHVVRDDD